MNRREAKKLAETVTLDELKQMFINAQKSITDWTRVSRVNKGLTIGTSFNILSSNELEKYDSIEKVHPVIRKNMIWEFGEYLPGYTKGKKETKNSVTPSHQEPIFPHWAK